MMVIYRLVGENVRRLHILDDIDGLNVLPLLTGTVGQLDTDILRSGVAQAWVIFYAQYDAEQHRVVRRRYKCVVRRRTYAAHRVEEYKGLVVPGIVGSANKQTNKRRFAMNYLTLSHCNFYLLIG